MLDSLVPILDLGDLGMNMRHLGIQLKQHGLAFSELLANLAAAVCPLWGSWLVLQQRGEVLTQLLLVVLQQRIQLLGTSYVWWQADGRDMDGRCRWQGSSMLRETLKVIPASIQQPYHISQDGSGMVKGGSHLYAQVVSANPAPFYLLSDHICLCKPCLRPAVADGHKGQRCHGAIP